jgi:hypothetical protein
MGESITGTLESLCLLTRLSVLHLENNALMGAPACSDIFLDDGSFVFQVSAAHIYALFAHQFCLTIGLHDH